MLLLRSLTWMRIYRRKALLAHYPMIMIVSGYTLDRYISMANPDRMEWVPTSLCENPSLSSPKVSVPSLNDLVLIWEVIVVFLNLHQDCVHWCITCCSWVWVQSDDDFLPDAHRAEGCGRPPLCHCGIFDPVFMCAECQGDLIRQMEDPTIVGKFVSGLTYWNPLRGNPWWCFMFP